MVVFEVVVVVVEIGIVVVLDLIDVECVDWLVLWEIVL